MRVCMRCVEWQEFEDAVTKLGSSGACRVQLHRRIASRLLLSAAFDAARFTRHLEDAYAAMWNLSAWRPLVLCVSVIS